VIRLIFLGLLFLATLSANEVNSTQDENISIESSLPKVLYLNFKSTPHRVIKGEIFPITIKTLSTVKEFSSITYELLNSDGLKLLNETPFREKDSKYFYDTFYFVTTHSNANIPDFKATIRGFDDTLYRDTTLDGFKLNVVTLNPKSNFANIVADNFELLEFKTTAYDDNHNIVVFVATAKNCDIASFRLKDAYKQGIESITESPFNSKLVYYGVIKKEIENLSFTYFNLLQNNFLGLNIPIIVDDDSVTTQTDLKPKDQSHDRVKMLLASLIALIAFLLILWRKKYIYLVFILIPLAYVLYIAIPSKEVCIKVGSKIYLLPVHNGTIFEKTNTVYYLQKEGSVEDFVKVKLKNEKIGWVKNEDICKD